MAEESPPSSVAQETGDRLRRMILDMAIGPGERLTERWVEAQLGASRTSVRTALFRLEAEGLIAREGRSWIVPAIDLTEIEQLFVYREVLEAASIRLSSHPIADDVFVEVEAVLDAVTPQASAEQVDDAGRRFHLWIAELSKNGYIRRGVADAMTRLRRVRWLETEPGHHGWDEHRAIVAALRDGETERAAELMTAHTRETRDRLVALLRDSRRTIRARGAAIK